MVGSKADKGPLLVLYNTDEALEGGLDAEAVRGVYESAEAIEAALRRSGRPVRSAGVGDARALIAALEQVRPALVVNLVESLEGRAELESASAFLYEAFGIPYTGSGPLCLALAQNKPLVKATLRGLQLPTADWCVLRDGSRRPETLEALRFPCIVKPASTDASHGIGPDSVVPDPHAALEQAERLWRLYGPEVLVEEFVDGRELNVAVVGNGTAARCLPIAEIDFRLAPGLPRVVTYAAKWIEGSEEWGQSEVLCPAPLEPRLAARVEQVSLAAYRALLCQDYGRVDLRLTTTGEPVILEVNPNPDLAPTAGLARSASRMEWSYDELIEHIVRAAEQRTVEGA